jgi:hypothetical protein
VVAERAIGGGNDVNMLLLVGVEVDGEDNEPGGGMILLIGGGGMEGVMGFAPRARAAELIGLGVTGSD